MLVDGRPTASDPILDRPFSWPPRRRVKRQSPTTSIGECAYDRLLGFQPGDTAQTQTIHRTQRDGPPPYERNEDRQSLSSGGRISQKAQGLGDRPPVIGEGWYRRLVPDAHGAQAAGDDGAVDPIPIANEGRRLRPAPFCCDLHSHKRVGLFRGRRTPQFKTNSCS